MLEELPDADVESDVLEELSDADVESDVLEELSDADVESDVLEELSNADIESDVLEELSNADIESDVLEELSDADIESDASDTTVMKSTGKEPLVSGSSAKAVPAHTNDAIVSPTKILNKFSFFFTLIRLFSSLPLYKIIFRHFIKSTPFSLYNS